jgi:predicted Rossmann fold nucleotide-binding protein DprA/Smf involved in DNA uptake
MPEALAVVPKPSESLALQWLALALTPRLGPTRARRLVEHFGGVQNIFKASLTELEASGIQTVSAQSLGTGQSMELAYDELGRVAAAGVSVVCMDDSTYPAQLRQIYVFMRNSEITAPPRDSICSVIRGLPPPAMNRKPARLHLYSGESELPPHERKILKLLKADEATHIDEIVELLELDMSSSEIFAALFELELAGKVKQMPGKNFVKSF